MIAASLSSPAEGLFKKSFENTIIIHLVWLIRSSRQSNGRIWITWQYLTGIEYKMLLMTWVIFEGSPVNLGSIPRSENFFLTNGLKDFAIGIASEQCCTALRIKHCYIGCKSDGSKVRTNCGYTLKGFN